MNNLNSILIEGNLTQDPELSTTPGGRSVCKFSIATNRYYRNAAKELVNEVSFIDVDTWGSLAEGCAKYLKKGRGARIVGRLKQDRWKGEDDRMRERYVVIAEHVDFHPEVKAAQPAEGQMNFPQTGVEHDSETDNGESSVDGAMVF